MDGEMAAAVLALVAVAGQDIAAIQVDALLGQAIITQQPDHARNLDLEIDRADPVFVGLFEMGPFLAGFQPRLEGIVGESPFVPRMNDLGQLPAKQGEGPADAYDMDGHIEPIEHKDAGVERTGGVRGKGIRRPGRLPAERGSLHPPCDPRLLPSAVAWGVPGSLSPAGLAAR